MDPRLQEIYQDEMRQRIENLRLALAMCGARDERARREALYEAHLQAHTMKGTSEQLGFKDAARLGAAMSDALELGRERNELSKSVVGHLERGCTTFSTWLDNGRKSGHSLVIAAAAFSLDDEA